METERGTKLIYMRVRSRVHHQVKEVAKLTGRSIAHTVDDLLAQALGLGLPPVGSAMSLDDALRVVRDDSEAA